MDAFAPRPPETDTSRIAWLVESKDLDELTQGPPDTDDEGGPDVKNDPVTEPEEEPE